METMGTVARCKLPLGSCQQPWGMHIGFREQIGDKLVGKGLGFRARKLRFWKTGASLGGSCIRTGYFLKPANGFCSGFR